MLLVYIINVPIYVHNSYCLYLCTVIFAVFLWQEDQLSTVTGQNLALKRENESLHARIRRSRLTLSLIPHPPRFSGFVKTARAHFHSPSTANRTLGATAQQPHRLI